MIRGLVTSENEAVLRLSVRGPLGQSEDLPTVIDTGFNGYLTLPAAIVLRLGLPRLAPTRVTLADGTQTELDIVEATVLWDNALRVVPALEAGGGVLVGMAMLAHHRLIIEIENRGPVMIERMA